MLVSQVPCPAEDIATKNFGEEQASLDMYICM